MADNFRYRYGETDPAQVPIALGFPIAIGDLCYQDQATGTLRSVATFPWSGSAAATQAACAPFFVGVSAQRWIGTLPYPTGAGYPAGSGDGVNRVDTGGTYEFACLPGSNFIFGQDVTFDTAANALLPQQVIVTTAGSAAGIGKVVRTATNVSSIYIQIKSRLLAAPFLGT